MFLTAVISCKFHVGNIQGVSYSNDENQGVNNIVDNDLPSVRKRKRVEFGDYIEGDHAGGSALSSGYYNYNNYKTPVRNSIGAGQQGSRSYDTSMNDLINSCRGSQHLTLSSANAHANSHDEDVIGDGRGGVVGPTGSIECPDCSYKTERPFLMRTHSRYHTEAKLGIRTKFHQCVYPGCCYIASDSSNLKVHNRTHTGLKPFQCGIEGCMYKSAQSNNLKTHVRRNHPGYSFEAILGEAQDILNMEEQLYPTFPPCPLLSTGVTIPSAYTSMYTNANAAMSLLMKNSNGGKEGEDVIDDEAELHAAVSNLIDIRREEAPSNSNNNKSETEQVEQCYEI